MGLSSSKAGFQKNSFVQQNFVGFFQTARKLVTLCNLFLVLCLCLLLFLVLCLCLLLSAFLLMSISRDIFIL